MLDGVPVVNLSADGVTFVIVAVSLRYVLQQKRGQFPYVRSLQALVHILFEGVIVTEIWRNLDLRVWVIDWYTNLATSFILWDVVLLTLISYVVYVRPLGTGVVGRLRSVFWRWPHGVIFAAFVAFIAASNVYLIVDHPYTISLLQTLSGVLLPDTAFNNTFLYITFGTLLFFFAYPTVLLIRATLQVKDPDVRKALLVLPFCWGGIGAELFVFNGYLVSLDYDLVAVGYVVAAIVFGVAASVFRRATLLSTFFEPIAAVPRAPSPAATRGAGARLSPAVPLLIEVDPGTNYESAVEGYASEMASAGSQVFVFTSRGSPVHNGLSTVHGVRFFILTSKVSYPRPSEQPNELLVPENDTAVLLDLLDKTIASTGEGSVLFVIDNISSFILYLGFESTYKFVKQANEILDTRRAYSVYLVASGAHDERITSLTKSLDSKHASYGPGGLKVTRGADASAAAAS